MQSSHKHLSKFISLVLRHQPETIGLVLNEHGWANVQELIEKINLQGNQLTIELLHEIVDSSDKQRFSFNESKTCIRANQGHSIAVELNLAATIPPAILYHGTAEKYLHSILQIGLQKQQRQHVHLSATVDTAKAVGSRHGKPIVLSINAQAMHAAGYTFYLSENKVWLTDAVPVKYIVT
ncbi:MAG: RNA 2'-phosphotransferase [Chitinophagaceae bacterium]|jgi:putative RNA 2'-phosphotransferase|nr:RNA 2'-phosphotransferase [Chitinophagaceae bacterium]